MRIYVVVIKIEISENGLILVFCCDLLKRNGEKNI